MTFHVGTESLVDAAREVLPTGITLLTNKPVRATQNGLLVHVFVLGFSDKAGNAFTHIQQVEPDLPTKMLLWWALEDFRDTLTGLGYTRIDWGER